MLRRFMDTREVLVVTPTSDGANVDLMEDLSNARLDAWFAKHGSHKVGQGPVCRTAGAALRTPGCHPLTGSHPPNLTSRGTRGHSDFPASTRFFCKRAMTRKAREAEERREAMSMIIHT